MGTGYHVTSIRNGGVYGHAESHCDASGCNGSEMFMGSRSGLPDAEVGAVLEMDESAAVRIVEHLESLALREQMEEYANDTSGNASLAQFRSLVETRMGGRVTESDWDEAMDLIRERFEA